MKIFEILHPIKIKDHESDPINLRIIYNRLYFTVPHLHDHIIVTGIRNTSVEVHSRVLLEP